MCLCNKKKNQDPLDNPLPQQRKIKTNMRFTQHRMLGTQKTVKTVKTVNPAPSSQSRNTIKNTRIVSIAPRRLVAKPLKK